MYKMFYVSFMVTTERCLQWIHKIGREENQSKPPWKNTNLQRKAIDRKKGETAQPKKKKKKK